MLSYYLAKRFSLIISIKYIHIWGPISLNNRLFKRLAKIWTLHFPFTNLCNPQLVRFGLQLHVDLTFPGFAAYEFTSFHIIWAWLYFFHKRWTSQKRFDKHFNTLAPIWWSPFLVKMHAEKRTSPTKGVFRTPSTEIHDRSFLWSS